MTEFAQNILALLGKSEAEIRPLLPEKHGGFSPRPASLHLLGRSAVLAGSEDGVPLLLVVADSRRRLPDGFEGEQTALADGGVLADLAPTMLDMMGLPQPAEMTGHSLLVK